MVSAEEIVNLKKKLEMDWDLFDKENIMKKENVYLALDYNVRLLTDIIEMRMAAIYKVGDDDQLKNVLMRLDDLEKDTTVLLSDMHLIIKDYLVEADKSHKRIGAKYVSMMMSDMRCITRGLQWLNEKYALLQEDKHLI